MIHMNEETAERGATSVVDVSADDEYRPASSGLSPRRGARAQLSPKALLSVRSDDDEDVFPSDGEGYDSDGKPPALKRFSSTESVDDDRFRVNGIVVDREVRGGAKENWEDVYQVLFKSSTPNGQRMALTLLIMVSISVTVGAFALDAVCFSVG